MRISAEPHHLVTQIGVKIVRRNQRDVWTQGVAHPRQDVGIRVGNTLGRRRPMHCHYRAIQRPSGCHAFDELIAQSIEGLLFDGARGHRTGVKGRQKLHVVMPSRLNYATQLRVAAGVPIENFIASSQLIIREVDHTGKLAGKRIGLVPDTANGDPLTHFVSRIVFRCRRIITPSVASG